MPNKALCHFMVIASIQFLVMRPINHQIDFIKEAYAIYSNTT